MKIVKSEYNIKNGFFNKNFYLLRFVIIPFFVSMRYRLFPIKKKISRIKVKTNNIRFVMKIDTDGKGRFPVINTILLRILGIYEPETSSVIFNEINKGDVVLEIGAAYGYFTAQMSKLVGNNGHVISIEPATHMNSVCAETISLNNLNNVHLIKKALIPKKKKIDFLNSYENIHLEHIIKSYKLNSINFIFIDVDASGRSGKELRQELDLLKSILPILNKFGWYPKIFLEYVEQGKDFENIYEVLLKFGYEMEEVTKRHFLCIKKSK